MTEAERGPAMRAAFARLDVIAALAHAAGLRTWPLVAAVLAERVPVETLAPLAPVVRALVEQHDAADALAGAVIARARVCLRAPRQDRLL